jgi:hypothetical protein
MLLIMIKEVQKIIDQEEVECVFERDEMNVACSLCIYLKVMNNVKAAMYQDDIGREFVAVPQPNVFKK